MTIKEAMTERHSVRRYTDRALDDNIVFSLQEKISECNLESGLNIQLVRDEPLAFDSRMAHYGKFSGVKNYLALVGKKGEDLEEKCGYYGEKIVLHAQSIGLNTCWVALTYKKIPGVFEVKPGEKLVMVIAIGFGATGGSKRKSKTVAEVSNADENSPRWFTDGVEAALLAPTAMNQQKFFFEFDGEKVAARSKIGFNVKTDLGIAKYHFEVGSGKDKTIWK